MRPFTHNIFSRILLSVVLLAQCLLCYADVRTISSADGLSNNAVFSMCQDSFGRVWVGTADGLNIWNGHSLRNYKPADEKNFFAGNGVRQMFMTDDDNLWLRTTYGIARINVVTDAISYYDDFPFTSILASSYGSVTYLVDQGNSGIYYYNAKSDSFEKSSNQFLTSDELPIGIVYADDGTAFLFTDRNIYCLNHHVDPDTGVVTLTVELKATQRIRRVSLQVYDGCCWFSDYDNKIYRFDLSDSQVSLYADISSGMPVQEKVNAILPVEGGIYVGLNTRGLFYIDGNQDDGVRRQLAPTPVKNGVFSLMNDSRQQIIWVGTDCGGLKRWHQGNVDFEGITYDDLRLNVKMPVRSLFLDKNNTLWCGTKGDGIICIKDYSAFMDLNDDNIVHLTTADSELANDAVYAITPSSGNWIWIGSDGPGLNYYSYSDARIRSLPGTEDLKEIHSIYEQNDSTVWIATNGCGVYEGRFASYGGRPVIRNLRRVEFPSPLTDVTKFFSIHPQNDSIIWLGSRGAGAASLNTSSGLIQVHEFPTDKGYASNDIFYVSKSDKMNFASGSGLVTYDDSTGLSKISPDIPNRLIHGILNSSCGDLWLSTNYGLVCYDENTGRSVIYDKNTGLDVLEYSDGACFKDEKTGDMFFGGINGITVVREKGSDADAYDYTPEINILAYVANSRIHPLEDELVLPYFKSTFGVKFSLVDNINYSNYVISYNIEGLDGHWIDNSHDDIVHVNALPPGNYTLRIRYHNRSNSYTSDSAILPIRIIPPAYASWWAKCIYVLAILCAVYFCLAYLKRKSERAKEQLMIKYEENVRKAKTNTVNKIADEISMGTTFILGVCEQILQDSEQDRRLTEKVGVVEYSISKLNRMVYMLNEYRNISDMESENVSLVPVSDVASEIINLLKSTAVQRGISVNDEIDKDIIWAVDKGMWITFFNLMLSSAMNILRDGEELSVYMTRRGNELDMSLSVRCGEEAGQYVAYQAEGAAAYDESKLQKEYRNCLMELHAARVLLGKINGDMHFRWDAGNGLLIIDMLFKQMEASAEDVVHEEPAAGGYMDMFGLDATFPAAPESHKPDLDTIAVISRNSEVAKFIRYFLTDKYNVVEFASDAEALESMRLDIPALLIYDVARKLDEFPDFVRELRNEKFFSGVQIIALTSALQYAERPECIKHGADLCISFPFNVEYLQTSIERLLQKKSKMAEFYSSASSSFVLEDGKTIHVEDKAFIKKLMNLIDENIHDPDLSVSFLADRLAISTRMLYRRLECVSDVKPQKLIKDVKMAKTERLLLTTKLTIDEIMYKVGYENRSTFYKNFKEYYGMTPKEYRDNAHQSVRK